MVSIKFNPQKIGLPKRATVTLQVQNPLGLADLRLDAVLHAGGQRVARALHAGQVGEHELVAAGRERGQEKLTVTLGHYQTAHVILQIADVANFPPASCHPATADTLRVYAPGNYSAMRFPFSFRACARKGPVYMHVSTTISGTGIPGYSS